MRELDGCASNPFFACGSKVLAFILHFVVALAERNNEMQKVDKVLPADGIA
jgi:hypothetical protein